MGRRRLTNHHLPVRVYERKGKLYYVAKDGRWHRLKDGIDLNAQLEAFQTWSPKTIIRHLRNCFMRARLNAKRRSLEFSITWDDVQELWRRSEGRCEVSGVRFDFARVGHSKRRPFVPSIDRINAAIGYRRENIRLVCFAVNAALSDWGDSVLRLITRRIRSGEYLTVKNDRPETTTEARVSL